MLMSEPTGPEIIDITVQEPYYDDIMNHTKIFEGRLLSKKLAGKLQDLDNGQILIVRFTATDSKRTLMRTIRGYQAFPSFEDMLTGREKAFLPRAKSFQKAVQLYKHFPWYKAGVKKWGCVALYIPESMDISDLHDGKEHLSKGYVFFLWFLLVFFV